MTFSISKNTIDKIGVTQSTLVAYGYPNKEQLLDFFVWLNTENLEQYIVTEWDEDEDIVEQVTADLWLEDNQEES